MRELYKNILTLIDENSKKEKELSCSIEETKTYYNNLLTQLTVQKQHTKEQNTLLLNSIFELRLGDLLEEISTIANVDICDLKVTATTNIFLTEEDDDFSLSTLNKLEGNSNLTIDIRAKEHNAINPLKILITTPVAFNKKQADGKILFEHCSVRQIKTTYGTTIFEVIVDKNLEDLICEFKIEQILKDACGLSKPKDILKQAIENCCTSETYVSTYIPIKL